MSSNFRSLFLANFLLIALKFMIAICYINISNLKSEQMGVK